jgi:hypothetical protein
MGEQLATPSGPILFVPQLVVVKLLVEVGLLAVQLATPVGPVVTGVHVVAV